jgi:molecular chaperone HtpG
MEQIKLQIETEKIISLLASEIYDSPYALLRENVQNAYDAILMRLQMEDSFEPKITVKLEGNQIIITDNGIGMTIDTLKNNYWKAGSSGKNNDDARRAGVVGTFGIGAMANFGICKYLKIKTHYFENNCTIVSDVERDKLSISDDCININEIHENREPGTTIYATLDNSVLMNEVDAINYISPYVQYLDIPVYFNDTLISKKKYYNDSFQAKMVFNNRVKVSDIDCNFKICIIDGNGSINVYVDKITLGENEIKGDMFFEQGKGSIFGLRNKFGLAAIPINSTFNFGGIINLSVLQPTAGREAVSRESIQFVTNIIINIEKISAEELSKHDSCDYNRYFLNYIVNNNRFDLAKKILIQMLPDRTFEKLDCLQNTLNGKTVFYYSGSDKQIIDQYANENTLLLLLSNENPRRNIQQIILRQKKIEQISDNPKILRILDREELSPAEFAVMLRMANTLKDDYLINDVKVEFAEISHRAPNLVEYNNGILSIYLSRESGNILQVLNIYKESYELFDPFIKDYVRNYLYQKIAPYVPSSTRQGADALFKILQRKRELYTINPDELGDIESFFKDFSLGKITVDEVLKASIVTRQQQAQIVKSEQVGTVEQELPNIISTSITQDAIESISINPDVAAPSIHMLDNDISKKILRTEMQYPQLNNYTLFLSLSDSLYQKQNDFFLEPHITKVIWGMHKIIYIFTHASNRITLYYEIELRDSLGKDQTGGYSIPTTTIISKNKIFIPIIKELKSCFEIKDKQLSFHVRHDLIFSSGAT